MNKSNGLFKTDMCVTATQTLNTFLLLLAHQVQFAEEHY